MRGRRTRLEDAGGTVDDGGSGTGLGNGSVVPDVAFVREHVCHISEIPLLCVLFERIERLFGRYLAREMKAKDSFHVGYPPPQMSSEGSVLTAAVPGFTARGRQFRKLLNPSLLYSPADTNKSAYTYHEFFFFNA